MNNVKNPNQHPWLMGFQPGRKASTAPHLKSYTKAVCVCGCGGKSGANWNFPSFKNGGQEGNPFLQQESLG